MSTITPERRAASRLGWIVIWALVVGEFLALASVILVPYLPWFVSIPLAVIISIIFLNSEPSLYRWVTKPERENIK